MRRVVLVLPALLLGACSSGGSESTPEPTLTVSITMSVACDNGQTMYWDASSYWLDDGAHQAVPAGEEPPWSQCYG